MRLKIKLFFVLILSIVFLTSCSLAKEDNLRNNEENIDLVGVKLILNSYTNQEVILKLYFNAENEEEFGYINLHVKHSTLEIDDKVTYLIELEADVLINRENNEIISINSIYKTENENEEEYNELLTSYTSNVDFSHSLEEKITFNGETHIKRIKINFIMVDTLKELIIKEYDNSNTLVDQSIITNGSINEYKYKINTSYIVLTEVYLVENQDQRLRSLYNVIDLKYFLMKFTNESGIIDTKYLKFIKQSQVVL